MPASLREIDDSQALDGVSWLVTAAHGAKVPLRFASLVLGGQAISSADGYTFRLVVKEDLAAENAEALVNAGNAELSFGGAPFAVGYQIDTTAAGFAACGRYRGSFWATHAAHGSEPLEEFILFLLPDSLKP